MLNNIQPTTQILAHWLIDYGIQETDFRIEGSFTRKDGDSDPVAVFDIEIRNYSVLIWENLCHANQTQNLKARLLSDLMCAKFTK